MPFRSPGGRRGALDPRPARSFRVYRRLPETPFRSAAKVFDCSYPNAQTRVHPHGDSRAQADRKMKFFDFESAFDEAAPTSPAPKPAPKTSTSSSSTTAKSTPASTPAPAAKPASTSGSKSSFNFNQFTSLLRKGGELAKVGTQVAGQFSGGSGSAPTAAAAVAPAPEPTPTVAPAAVDAQPSPAPPADVPLAASPPAAGPVPGQSAPGVDQIALLLQALQQQQAQAGPAAAAFPGVAPPPAAPPPDGMALLRVILGNPQFQQALWRPAQQPGAPTPRAIGLPVQAGGHPAHTRQMQIPMGAVLNAIATLAGHSMAELNESTAEDEPEVPAYLVGEDGEFLVDPTSAEERAALVTRWFLASDAAQRGPRGAHPMNVGHQSDPSDVWAREAGFPM